MSTASMKPGFRKMLRTLREQHEAKSAPLSGSALEGLRHLWDVDRFKFKGHFPGAIGRAGTTLVKRGLAENLGRTVYAGNCPSMGEGPDAYTEFRITEAGRKMARSLFMQNNKLSD